MRDLFLHQGGTFFPAPFKRLHWREVRRTREDNYLRKFKEVLRKSLHKITLDLPTPDQEEVELSRT